MRGSNPLTAPKPQNKGIAMKIETIKKYIPENWEVKPVRYHFKHIYNKRSGFDILKNGVVIASLEPINGIYRQNFKWFLKYDLISAEDRTHNSKHCTIKDLYFTLKLITIYYKKFGGI